LLIAFFLEYAFTCYFIKVVFGWRATTAKQLLSKF
jgi:hypothetical protein